MNQPAKTRVAGFVIKEHFRSQGYAQDGATVFPAINGKQVWIGHGVHRPASDPDARRIATEAAERLIARIEAEENVTPAVVKLTAMGPLRTRDDIARAGFVPGWHGEPVAVGDTVVVYGRGQWRRGLVFKVTATLVHAWVSTPASPTLMTVAKGDRTGLKGSNLYV